MAEISQEVPAPQEAYCWGLLQAQRVQRQGLQGAERTSGVTDYPSQVHILPPCLAMLLPLAGWRYHYGNSLPLAVEWCRDSNAATAMKHAKNPGLSRWDCRTYMGPLNNITC